MELNVGDKIQVKECGLPMYRQFCSDQKKLIGVVTKVKSIIDDWLVDKPRPDTIYYVKFCKGLDCKVYTLNQHEVDFAFNKVKA